MSSPAEITFTINENKYTYNQDSVSKAIPGAVFVPIEIHKEGYNPVYTGYIDTSVGSNEFKSKSLNIQLETYTPVTLTVNSTQSGTTLVFDDNIGTVNGNTITVAKGTKVTYHLSKEGYNTLDRIVYVNENTIETETLDEAVWSFIVNTSSVTNLILPFDRYSTSMTAWNNTNSTLTVDWGDNSTSTIGKNFTAAQVTHAYSDGLTTHTVSITSNTGIMPAVRYYGYSASTIYGSNNITEILTPLLKMCTTDGSYMFYNMTALTAVPATLFKYNAQLITFKYTFRSVGLTLPEKFLYYNTEITDTSYMFHNATYAATGSIKNIPSDLLAYSPNISNVSYMFYYAISITSIPENLFANLKNLENVSYAFCYCNAVTSIPENIFKYNTNLRNAAYVFAYLRNANITSISENIFKYNTELLNVAGAFRYCMYITAAPENIFKYNTKLQNISYVFANCTRITTIPENIFSTLTNVTNALGIFAFCPINNKTPLEFINMFNNTRFVVGGIGFFNSWTHTTNADLTSEYVSTFFSKCNSLAYLCSGWYNLTTIPSDLISSYTNITSGDYMFYYCNNITSIPEDLFKYNTAITSFSYAFYYCTKLTTIPSNLFKYNTEVTRFNYVFGYNTALTAIPADLFRYNTKVTTFDDSFYYCTALTTVPADLFKYNLLVTAFSYTFYYCNKLTMRSDLFGDLTNRFKQQSSLTFNYFFYVYNWSGTKGTAPALWNCTFTNSSGATITPTKTYCFYGHKSASLSNYSSIPSAWK